MNLGALALVDRHVEGVVEMVPDATVNCDAPSPPSAFSAGIQRFFPPITAASRASGRAAWRDDVTGPMQVVYGPAYRQRVHYQAPPAEQLEAQMDRFVRWANAPKAELLVFTAGLAHLWFVTRHPFDDGNGRIARPAGNLFLAHGDGSSQRFYSLSAQIQREREAYCDALEAAQKGSLNVTEWLLWFLDTLQRWAITPLNTRQAKLLNRLLNGFDGKLNTSKWAAIAKCSPDAALRDIGELLALDVLRKCAAGGRSTSYELSEVLR